MIRTGELKKRVVEQGLRGITANPATFQKAIAGSNEYDEQIRHLIHEGRMASKIYQELVVMDIQKACDILREVYDASGGMDGFVILEVSPHLAYNAESTTEEARCVG